MATGFDKYDHIVYLMLENRSLDNVLGWLYADRNNVPYNLTPYRAPYDYQGLRENTYYNLNSQGVRQYVTKGTGGYMNVPSLDPYEEYAHVNNQLFGSQATPSPPQAPSMGGFYQDYYSRFDSAYQIMQTYTPQELPVLNTLARQFAVSDMYFSSLPTQTNCNRAFSITGNSLGPDKNGVLTGWVDNHWDTFPDPFIPAVTFNQRTMWNVMSDNNKGRPSDWMIFYSEIWHKYCYTRDMFTQIQSPRYDPNFGTIEDFYALCQSGNLPTFSYLEPEWGLKYWHIGENGNDYHPPCNLGPGEAFVWQVYRSIFSNPTLSKNTLLIINFDEHGGTYDHVPPGDPTTGNYWNALPPWGYGTPQPTVTEGNFQFNRYGVRVPMLLIGPYIPQGTVFRSPTQIPFDHTSVIATVLNKMNIPKNNWGLGARTYSAPTFEFVSTLEDTPQNMELDVQLNTSYQKDKADYPYNDLQLGIAHRVLRYAADENCFEGNIHERLNDKLKEHRTQTVSGLSRSVHELLEELS